MKGTWGQFLFILCIVKCIICNGSREKRSIVKDIEKILVQETCPPDKFINLTDSNPVPFPKQEINKKCELKFIYEIDEGAVFDEGKAFHIDLSVSKMDVTMKCPVLVSIFQQQRIVPVILPYSFDPYNSHASVFYEAGRTLCTSSPNKTLSDGRNITVHITTCSDSLVHFNLTAQLRDDLLLRGAGDTNATTNSSHIITLTAGPSTPQYLVYKFPKKSDNQNRHSSARITIKSEDYICMIVSIQTIYCPIYDEEVDVKYPSDLFKTMTRSSVVVVEQDGDKYSEGFAIVFVVKHDNKECMGLLTPGNGKRGKNDNLKTFTVSVEENSGLLDVEQIVSIFMPLLFSVVITALTFLGYKVHQRYLSEWTAHLSINETEDSNRLLQEDRNAADPNERREQSTSSNQSGIDFQFSPPSVESTVSTIIPKSGSLYLNEFNVRKELKSIGNDNGEASIKMKTGIDHFRKKYNPQHFWSTLLLVAIFYAIPVYELVINFLITLNMNGDYDYCFYNELCSYHFGPVLDVNHYWSNISYFLLGGMFCFIVKWNGKFLEKLPTTRGIAFQKELFYGLGIALMMEGFFSGAYHLCPNKFTFQYDTTFMYVVSSLVLVKLFLSRHPIKHFTASKTYTGLAILVSLTAVSYLVDISPDKVIKTVFCYVYLIGQTLTMFCFTIYYCDVGLIKNDEDFGNANVSLMIIWDRIKYFFCFLFYRTSPTMKYGEKYPFIWKRAIVPFLAMCTSIVVFILLTEKGGKGFATVLLFTIVSITVICTSSYIFMKCLNKEFYGEKKIFIIFPAMCFLLCIAFGGAAVFFFQQTSYDSDDSPAESRSKNRNCIFMHFYDAHDMWHMLSSMSLFIGYMGLLTMDDGLANTPLENIAVF